MLKSSSQGRISEELKQYYIENYQQMLVEKAEREKEELEMRSKNYIARFTEVKDENGNISYQVVRKAANGCYFDIDNVNNKLTITGLDESVSELNLGTKYALKSASGILKEYDVEIAPGAFENHPNLKTLFLHTESAQIPERMCNNCKNLGSVILVADNVRILGEACFCNCNLKSFELPRKTSIIDQAAFYGNDLEEININECCIQINDYAFGNNENLKATVAGLAHISQDAFDSREQYHVNIDENIKDIFGNEKSESKLENLGRKIVRNSLSKKIEKKKNEIKGYACELSFFEKIKQKALMAMASVVTSIMQNVRGQSIEAVNTLNEIEQECVEKANNVITDVQNKTTKNMDISSNDYSSR